MTEIPEEDVEAEDGTPADQPPETDDGLQDTFEGEDGTDL